MKKNVLMIVALAVNTVVFAADNKVKTESNKKEITASSSSSSSVAKITDLSGQDLSKLNIRFIESYDAMGRCAPGQECGKELEAMRQKLSVELERDQQKMQQVVTEFQAKAATMSEVSRASEEKKLRKMEADFTAKLKESELEMKAAMQKVTEGLAKDMKEAVAQLAKNEKYDAVIDKSSGQVLYVADNLDITDTVIKKMDTEHNKKIAANKKTQSGTALATNTNKAPQKQA